nr:P-selectin-like [Lytechinus pictus]
MYNYRPNGYCDETKGAIVRYSELACFRRRKNEDPINWQEALDLCKENRELLATIKDAETQAFLVDFAVSKIDNNAWIGAMEGRDWKWRNSDKYIERFFWQSPFPGGGRDDCIELFYHNGSFFWSPRSRNDDVAFICQYDQHCQSMDLEISNMVLEYMGNCFQFIDDPTKCRDAAGKCPGTGGFLAEIYDESTNALLAARALYLKDNNLADGPWWIGGYDDDTRNERSWFWSDQTRLFFDAWHPDQPSGNVDCVEMRKQNNYQYQWNNRDCTEDKRVLCQIGIPACGDPGQPLHGNRLPDDRTTYLDGATLHFSCNEGFILSGEEILTCMTNGSWNHSRPFCEAVKCEGMPPNVTRASKSMVESAYYRDTTVYTCDDGYIPDNVPISFCQHTGSWSIPNFTCSALSPCYSNPCINGGTCNVNGSSFICTCPEGYIGTTCDEEFNPCDSNPCMNGGSCFV